MPYTNGNQLHFSDTSCSLHSQTLRGFDSVPKLRLSSKIVRFMARIYWSHSTTVLASSSAAIAAI
jgi:hypothetical protein